MAPSEKYLPVWPSPDDPPHTSIRWAVSTVRWEMRGSSGAGASTVQRSVAGSYDAPSALGLPPSVAPPQITIRSCTHTALWPLRPATGAGAIGAHRSVAGSYDAPSLRAQFGRQTSARPVPPKTIIFDPVHTAEALPRPD